MDDKLRLGLDLGSEVASVLYVDEVVDGQGLLLLREGGLTSVAEYVTVDSVRSVSGLFRSGYLAEEDGCDGEAAAEPPPLFLKDLWRGYP